MAAPLAALAKEAAQKVGKQFAQKMARKAASGVNKNDPDDPLAKKKKSPVIMGAIILGGAAVAPIAGSELNGTFTHNVVDKLAEESAEKDINDLGSKYDETDPSEMYKAGAYILREMVERAYKKTQLTNEEEIKKYSDEIGTYKNRKSRYADVFMPVESREKYTNNANAPRVDISYILAAYNVSMADMVPKHGYLLDLKSKVFKTDLYKDMYSYRSTLKSRDKVEYEYKTHTNPDGTTWVETIEHKYKEYWTESELDPFDDSIVLAHLFAESPYYQIEKVLFDQAPEDKNGFKKATKDWETAKKKQEEALREKIKNITGKGLKEDEDLVRQREEQMKSKYLAKRFVEFIYRQPYYGSHIEYEYEDGSTLSTIEKTSIYGYKNKSFFFNKNPMQKYVRNNYYDTQRMDNGKDNYKSKALLKMNKKEGFWNKAKGIFEQGKATFDSLFNINNDVYKNSKFERRKMGTEGTMDIDEEGNVIEKARKKNDDKIKFKEAGDLTTSKESKQGYWADLDDQDDEIDITGTHIDTEANKTGKPAVKYDDYAKENPDLMAWHEKIRKNTIKNKDKATKGEFYKGLPIIDGMGSSLVEFEREKQAELQSLSESKRKNIGSKNRKDAYSLQKDLEKLDKKRQEEQSKNQSNNSSSSNVGATNGSNGSSSSNKGQQVVDMAAKYIGGRYVHGGNSLTGGVDCSGFTCQIYKRFGVNLPRKSDAQINAGRKVSSLSEAKPGDLLVFKGHVGIYAGNGYMIHASSPSTGIIKTKVTYGGHRIVGIRRLVNDPLPNTPPPFTGNVEIGRSQWHGITAEQLDSYFKGALKGTGKYFIKYGNQYGVNPAVLAAISMNETGNGTSSLANNRNNFFGMRRRGWLKFDSKEKGIEAGARNIGKNYIALGMTNFDKMVKKYAEGQHIWVSSNDYFLRKITGKNQYQINFGKGTKGGGGIADGGITEDDSESTASPSQSFGSTALGGMFNGQTNITQKMIEEDGRGLIVAQFDVDFDNKTDGPSDYDKMYAPVNVRQKIMQFQTSMYNSIEPPPGLDAKSADEEHRHSKYYNYTKELEDRIWGGFRRDNHNFLILFNFETKKDLKGEGLDLDVLNKVVESGEARAFGFGQSSNGGGIAAIVEKAKSHLGEGPLPTQSWFGMYDYWCAMFVSRVMHEAGIPKNAWKKTAGTREALPFAKKNGWFRKPSEYKPSPGDPIWFYFGRVSPTDHIGIVEKVEGDTVVTIEGNSSNMVKRNKYKLTDPHIVGYMDIATAVGGGSGEKVASLGGSTVGSEVSNEGGTGEVTTTQTSEGVENKTTASMEDLLDLTGSSLHSMSGYLQGDDVDKAYRYLRSRGYSAPAASAVMAAMVLKSGGEFENKDNKLAFKNLDRGKNETNDKSIAKKQEKLVKLIEEDKKAKEYKSTKNKSKIDKLQKEIFELEKSSSGIGILGWKGERAVGQYGLKDFAKRYGRDWKSIEAQVGFVDWELTHTFTENFRDAPRPDYITLGHVKNLGYKTDKASVDAYNKMLKQKESIIKKYTKDFSYNKLNDEEIKDKYTKEMISKGVGWNKDLIDFKRIGIKLNLETLTGNSPELHEASDVMYYCYLYPDGKNKSGQNKLRNLTKLIFVEFALGRELNINGKDEYKDYIARRNKTSVKESYLLLPDNARGQGNNEQGGEIMEFKGAICTGFNDAQLAIGPAQGKNAVAAHNMPYGTIIEIPQLKGKMGGGTFKSTRSGKTYDLGPINNGKFIVADTGGPFFDFDIWGFSGGKVNMDVKVISWGEGEGMSWSITEAIQDAQKRGTWGKYQKAFNNTNTTYGGFKTKALSKFKNHDINNSLIK